MSDTKYKDHKKGIKADEGSWLDQIKKASESRYEIYDKPDKKTKQKTVKTYKP